MKIASSSIDMASANQSAESVKVTQVKTTKVTDGTLDRAAQTQGTDGKDAQLDLSQAVKDLVDESKEQAANKLASISRVNASAFELPEVEDYRITLLRRVIEILTGKKIEDSAIKKLKNKAEQPAPAIKTLQASNMSAEDLLRATSRQRTFSTVTFNSVEVNKSEKVSFQANGTVTTEDGRSIDLSVVLNMSQEMYAKFEHTTVTETSIMLCDPLVVNFGAVSAGLSSQKFEFDLDCDGTADQISRLLDGSGFLCLDTYGDGVIRDGNQLFGTKSGDGFKDLAAHDGDFNGWIDENDEIFDKLRVWVKDENGKDTLFALGELGIGAIYLGNVNTQYSYNQSGSLDGMLRSTGIFLREDGTAGTMQHVDLSI